VLKQVWKGRYRGQTQKWFAFGFLGSDDEIDVATPGNGAFKSEFDAWRWEPMSGLPDLIVPFKRPVYEGVVAAFAGLTAWRAPS
jgi:putative (di)nucleoside polyphosphate hydrolase